MKPDTESEYEKKAREVAERIGLEIKCAFQGNQCPEWAEADTRHGRDRHACKECGTVHGDKFRVSIKRTGQKGSITFDFWASWADCNVEITPQMKAKGSSYAVRQYNILFTNKLPTICVGVVYKRKHTPSYYDVLCCVSSDMSGPTEADDVVREYGEMLPSRAIKIAEWTRKLQAFFSEAERELIYEVQ